MQLVNYGVYLLGDRMGTLFKPTASFLRVAGGECGASCFILSPIPLPGFLIHSGTVNIRDFPCWLTALTKGTAATRRPGILPQHALERRFVYRLVCRRHEGRPCLESAREKEAEAPEERQAKKTVHRAANQGSTGRGRSDMSKTRRRFASVSFQILTDSWTRRFVGFLRESNTFCTRANWRQRC